MRVKFSRKQAVFLIALFIVLFQTVFTGHVGENGNTPEAKELVKVTRVVDGDTIVVEGSKTVRYIGIDTPETKDPRKPVQCFGKEASDENKKLVEGKYVYLEKDVSETDKYGRLLRYVWLKEENSTKEATFINDYLVRQGYAHVATFPPDVNYAQQFLKAEQEARTSLRGLWKTCQ